MSTQAAKLLSAILAGLCGLLLLLAIALQFGFGRGYGWLVPDVEPLGGGDATVDRSHFKLPPETQFADTSARPLFNDDRKPTPDGPDDSATPPPPKVPLNIALTGIIMTPEVRIAMVHDKAKNNDVALKIGMPMPGDQGDWTLTEIKPRSAIFRESAGEEVEVELSTAVAGPTPNSGSVRASVAPPPGPHPQPSPVAAPGGEAPANQQAQALQQRIEQRRAQMRDEAERLRKQRADQNQSH